MLAQTLQDWEMLIIDDCSSDNTYRCMQKLAQKDNRIRIFRNKHNVGAAATRNYGIQEAQSQWIAFLDSDDLWRKEKLEKQMAILVSTHEASFLFTDQHLLRRWNDDCTHTTYRKRSIRQKIC